MSKNTRKKSPWTILVVMLISMVAGAICMNKVAPVLSNIMADLNITSGSQAGLLMSIFTFSGIILSIPMGVLITKYGTFKTGLFSLVAIIVGSALGAVSSGYGIMLVSRLIEGLGLMFLGTIGPAAVAAAFAGRNGGTAMNNNMFIASSNLCGRDLTSWFMGGSSIIGPSSTMTEVFYYGGKKFLEDGADESGIQTAVIDLSDIRHSFMEAVWAGGMEKCDWTPERYIAWYQDAIDTDFWGNH